MHCISNVWLRNSTAVDHGIEAAADRASAGKPEAGRLELAFRQDGSRIVVELSDDGAGLDEIAIARRAAELGLFPDNRQPSPNELHRTIFASGFSTRGEVSELSGRGIGLDAVRVAIQRLGGTIDLSSRPGHGVRIRMVLPHSLTSSHLLFVQVADARFALPSLGVSQVLFSDAGRLENSAGRWIFSFDERDYPMVRLADLLSMPGHATLDSLAEPRPLVLVESGSGQLALLVDGVIESREAVVKSIADHLPGLSGVSGACVLGDGDLAVVVDLARLQQQADSDAGELERRIMRKTAAVAPAAVSAPAGVLIVDDSLSARRSLSRLVTDLGYRTETAFDGFDALEKIEAGMPEALLLDLEMPRMNGLELTAHLRADQKTADLPIIMI
ncbi:MAG: chemotaxis protein CheW, partial [Xanthomonadaceae bacterium]|nr:chemotaxis protein CheW [Xanthomonadaceae bacterium]